MQLETAADRLAGLGFSTEKIAGIHRTLQVQAQATSGRDWDHQFQRLDVCRTGELGVTEFLSVLRGKLRVPMKALSDADAVAVHAALDHGESCSVEVRHLIALLACPTADFVAMALARGAGGLGAPPSRDPEMAALSSAAFRETGWGREQLARAASSSSLSHPLERLGAATLRPEPKADVLKDMLLHGVPPGMAEALSTSLGTGRAASPQRSRSPSASGGLRSSRGSSTLQWSKARGYLAAAEERRQQRGEPLEAPFDLAGERAHRVRRLMKSEAWRLGGRDWARLFARFDRDSTGGIAQWEFLRGVRNVLRIPFRELNDTDVLRLHRTLDLDGNGAIWPEELEKFIAMPSPSFAERGLSPASRSASPEAARSRSASPSSYQRPRREDLEFPPSALYRSLRAAEELRGSSRLPMAPEMVAGAALGHTYDLLTQMTAPASHDASARRLGGGRSLEATLQPECN